MQDYECLVVLENGAVHQWIIEANDLDHANNKLDQQLMFSSFYNIYKTEVKKVIPN